MSAEQAHCRNHVFENSPAPANQDELCDSTSISNHPNSRLPEYRDIGKRLLHDIAAKPQELYRSLNWQGSFEEYIGIIEKHPLVLRNAWQRLYDAIAYYGITSSPDGLPHYKLFDDPFNNGKDAVFGLERQLAQIVNIIKAASQGYGPQNRLLLLHGPVGTAKSTIARLLKNAVAEYSQQPEGALYTIGFRIPEGHPEYDAKQPDKIKWCPNNEEPLRLLSVVQRKNILGQILDGKQDIPHHLNVKGECCPACRQEFRELMTRYSGDLSQVLEHVAVRRLVLSETDRVGIGTFQPKDEKNQDSTELSGDINYRKIAVYGSDSDPRAFNFDGEFNIANRGILEFVEVLKLDTAFLYDLLGATQEHRIKPKKFAQTDIDEVVIGHTNEHEYKRLVANDAMEALRDRIIKVDIPYLLQLKEEERIYGNHFKRAEDLVAPHTFRIAALWAILTRLEEPNDKHLSILQKAKLYNGELVHGVSDAAAAAQRARELRAGAVREGMTGMSPRYVLDTISTTLSQRGELGISPLSLLSALQEKLNDNAMIKDEKVLKRFRLLVDVVRAEYEDIAKREVREALAKCNPQALAMLGSNYLEHACRWIEAQEQAAKDQQQDQQQAPAQAPQSDERLLRSIEEKMGVSPARAEDFRSSLVNTLRHRQENSREFDPLEDNSLRSAVEMKLFDDRRDSVKFFAAHPRAIAGLRDVVEYLQNNLGYSDNSARELLQYVGTLYARGGR